MVFLLLLLLLLLSLLLLSLLLLLLSLLLLSLLLLLLLLLLSLLLLLLYLIHVFTLWFISLRNKAFMYMMLEQTPLTLSARCGSVLERSLMVRWVIGSILHGGTIELFLVPASAPRLVQQRPLYVLSKNHCS